MVQGGGELESGQFLSKSQMSHIYGGGGQDYIQSCLFQTPTGAPYTMCEQGT